MTQGWTNREGLVTPSAQPQSWSGPDESDTTQRLSVFETPQEATQPLAVQQVQPLQPLQPVQPVQPLQPADPGPLSLSDALRSDWQQVKPSYDGAHLAGLDTARKWFAEPDNVLMAVTALVMLLLVCVVSAFGH